MTNNQDFDLFKLPSLRRGAGGARARDQRISEAAIGALLLVAQHCLSYNDFGS
jgi:hypothetical protein